MKNVRTIDNLMERLMFYVQIRFFQLESDNYQQEEDLFTFVTSDDEQTHGLLRGNNFRNGTAKDNNKTYDLVDKGRTIHLGCTNNSHRI